MRGSAELAHVPRDAFQRLGAVGPGFEESVDLLRHTDPGISGHVLPMKTRSQCGSTDRPLGPGDEPAGVHAAPGRAGAATPAAPNPFWCRHHFAVRTERPPASRTRHSRNQRQTAGTGGVAVRALLANHQLRDGLQNTKFDCLPMPSTSEGAEEHAKLPQQLLAIVFSSPAAPSSAPAPHR
jgi:hypothetical protein